MHKESALINKLNKQITVQFNNYTSANGDAPRSASCCRVQQE